MPKKSLLIIEDDPDIRESLKDIAGLDGFKVHEAENGRVALDILEKLPESPGLILLDLMMPVMDGQSFLHQIRGTRNEKIPVVVVSAAKKELEGKIIEFIEKPANARRILMLIKKYCGGEQS